MDYVHLSLGGVHRSLPPSLLTVNHHKLLNTHSEMGHEKMKTMNESNRQQLV